MYARPVQTGPLHRSAPVTAARAWARVRTPLRQRCPSRARDRAPLLRSAVPSGAVVPPDWAHRRVFELLRGSAPAALWGASSCVRGLADAEHLPPAPSSSAGTGANVCIRAAQMCLGPACSLGALVHCSHAACVRDRQTDLGLLQLLAPPHRDRDQAWRRSNPRLSLR